MITRKLLIVTFIRTLPVFHKIEIVLGPNLSYQE